MSPHLMLGVGGAGEGREAGGGLEERKPQLKKSNGILGRNSKVLSNKGTSCMSQDGTPGTVSARASPTHRHGNADRLGQPDWHQHGKKHERTCYFCYLLFEVFGISPYLQWLNVAVPPVIVGAVLSTVAADSCNTVGWEPNRRQLGVNLSVSKIIASINNPNRATLSPMRLIG